MSDPILLAIEASQRQGGVAVRDAAGEVHTESLAADRWHDDDLIAAVDRLFARLGLEPGDLGVVGVSVGPGGFTGLRIAVSTAKMFAETLGAQLVA
ncbi:MAG: tRNA (adenosine(37)-N6)-threonylcarbamoyltransferase complex dimerization subunit type 1 TsaB, partial [Planctomycetota bacterium]